MIGLKYSAQKKPPQRYLRGGFIALSCAEALLILPNYAFIFRLYTQHRQVPSTKDHNNMGVCK